MAKRLKRLVVPDDGLDTFVPSHIRYRAEELAEEVVVYPDRPESKEVLVERCKDADGVVCILATSIFDRELMEVCSNLRIISVWAAGVNHVDLEAAKDLGVTVTYTPGYGRIGVGEHTLALMLAVARDIPRIDRSIKERGWPEHLLVELHGKTLGVVGGGPIAQQVMKLGRGIGMKVIAWTMHPSPEREAEYGVEFMPIDDLCRTSDVIAVITALSEKTLHIIGRKQMELMKPEAIIVNTGRGALIDQEILVEFLSKGRIKGAGLDVLEEEPLPPDHPLARLDNVVMTSHAAANTPETTDVGMTMVLDNIASFLDGKFTNALVEGTR